MSRPEAKMPDWFHLPTKKKKKKKAPSKKVRSVKAYFTRNTTPALYTSNTLIYWATDSFHKALKPATLITP
jgi:hypothetical protein